MLAAATNFNSNNSDAGPPQLAVCLPSMRDVTTTLKQPDLPVDVLLVTVKDCEFLACYNELTDPYRYCYKDVGYVYFNNVQSHEEIVKIALLRCNEGSTGPNSSLIAVKNAAPILQPKAVISVGACSGLNPDKTKLGDIVVSAKLTTYAAKVVTSNQEQPAGMSSHVSRLFSKIISNCADGWQAPLKNPEDRQIKVYHHGEFLSGPERIRAEWRRKELADRHPLAIGVEMEGEGVFTAAFDTQLEWLIVKGITDFANGEQATAGSWEACASVMAASLVSHILSDPGVFRTWPHYSVSDDLLVAQLESSRKRKLAEHHAVDYLFEQLESGRKRKLAEHQISGALYDDQSSTQIKRGMFTAHTSQQTESTTQQHLAGVPSIIKRIRQLYKRREGRLVPFPWCEELDFNLNDIFTRLKIVNKEKTRGKLTDEITNMTAIFRPHPDCQKPRILLIEGEPGMGKTTYLQKLAYDWANEQDEWDESFPSIEVLLLLRCNDIKSSIWQAIDDQLLPVDIDEQAKEDFFRFIRENQTKVLLLLDGLDEADSCKLCLYHSLVQSKLLPTCHIAISSRHEVGKKVRPYCDTLWEIAGFIREDAESFIRKYFKGKEHLAEELIRRLISSWYDDDDDDDDDDDGGGGGGGGGGTIDPLKTLGDLTKNPLNTALLCCLFEDYEGVLPASRTQLYVEIVLFVLRRYEEKNGLESSSEDLISVYRKELLLLGSFALESLLKGKVHFEKKEEIVKSINFGFFSFQEGGTKRKPCTRCAFLHKSFQEFFAGFYLAFQIINKEIDCASVVADERYMVKLREAFLFMSGYIASQSQETAVTLAASLASRINFVPCEYDLSRFSGNFYASLTCSWLSECLSSDESLETRLGFTIGSHLNLSFLTKVNLSGSQINDGFAAAISRALTVNSTLNCLYLGPNSIGDAGASRLSQALTVNSTLNYLDLGYNSIGGAGASRLSQALTVNSTLNHLDLAGNSIGDAGASYLSQALTKNSALNYLQLGLNSISDVGASRLSQALAVNSSLTYLNLNYNSISDAGASCLSQALKVNSTLNDLNLGLNSIGETGASRLSQALKSNSSLTCLNLCENNIDDAGAICFSQALAINSSLTNLNLSGNYIGDNGASRLSQGLTANTTLNYLHLGSNSIGDTGSSCLCEALKVNSSLTRLNLNENTNIGEAGAFYLSQALTENSSLTNLDLSFNDNVGDAGASFLSQALRVNSSLTTLRLCKNNISDAGASILFQTLIVNSSLSCLDLHGNSIGDAGAFRLSQALRATSSLTWLNLDTNFIGVTGASYLSQALEVNSSLTYLNLNLNSINDDGASCLSQALKVNSSLTDLALYGNGISDTGASALSQALAVNSSLSDLNLNANSIGDDGVFCLSQALTANSSLTCLRLYSNRFGDAGADSLNKASKPNTTVLY